MYSKKASRNTAKKTNVYGQRFNVSKTSQKKFLRKNEFRMDNNPAHLGKKNKTHPAYISGKRGHKYLANSITHSRRTDVGATYDMSENPDKRNGRVDYRITRVSAPFWQNEKLFDKEKLDNFRWSKKSRARIKKINKKFK